VVACPDLVDTVVVLRVQVVAVLVERRHRRGARPDRGGGDRGDARDRGDYAGNAPCHRTESRRLGQECQRHVARPGWPRLFASTGPGEPVERVVCEGGAERGGKNESAERVTAPGPIRSPAPRLSGPVRRTNWRRPARAIRIQNRIQTATGRWSLSARKGEKAIGWAVAAKLNKHAARFRSTRDDLARRLRQQRLRVAFGL